MNRRLDSLDVIEKTGASKLLVTLLSGEKFVSELIKFTAESEGISSQPALDKSRRILLKAELIIETEKVSDLSGKTRLYISLTSKGRRVAEHLEAIVNILES